MAASITVGIPFFSGTISEQFRTALDSILTQSLHPDEVHLIQDGSVSEELSKLVNSYIESFPCVKHLIVEQNSGLAHALNFSILNTTSKYYARMDSDDIAHPQRLEKQVAFLNAHPDVDILGSWALEFEEDPLTEKGFVRQLPTESSEIESMFHYRNPFVHSAVVFRRSVFAKIGLYNVNFLDEDLELWSRAFQKKLRLLTWQKFFCTIDSRAQFKEGLSVFCIMLKHAISLIHGRSN